MTPPTLQFDDLSHVPTKDYDSIVPPSIFSLKRSGTVSTKESNTAKESHSSHDSSAYSSTHDSSAYSYFKFPAYRYNEKDNTRSSISYDSSITSRHSIRRMEKSNTFEFIPDLSEESIAEEESLQPLQDMSEKEDEECSYEDQVYETETKNRSLSLNWGDDQTKTSSLMTFHRHKSIIDDEFELPTGISKVDIMVTIDIDDEARTSRVEELEEEDLDVEILHHEGCDSENNNVKYCHRQRREFEETVRKGILDDLSSVYTATPKTAKLVLCVVISVLSDGTFDHTFWSGGRVGLSEIALQWVLFDADDLQVYKRGHAVQKKDFGFGPLGLTEAEGQHYLATSLAPRAANDIMRKVGNGERQDLLAEF